MDRATKDDDLSWSIHQETAIFRSLGHELCIRLNSPLTGIQPWHCFGHEFPVRPFQLAWPTSRTCSHDVKDAYFRGDDLVVEYCLGAREQASPQIVWCVQCEPAKLTVDVTIAMQTPYLSSHASVQSATDFSGDVVQVELSSYPDGSVVSWTGRPPVFLFRLPKIGLSYAELVCPHDLDATGGLWDGRRLSYRVMCESLEKGVIRKARMRGMVIPNADDASAAGRAFAAFTAESPPLTT